MSRINLKLNLNRKWILATTLLMTLVISGCENTIVAEYDTVRLNRLELKQDGGPNIILTAGKGKDGKAVLVISDEEGKPVQIIGQAGQSPTTQMGR